MAAKSPQILDDIFEVLEVDPDGKKFDKVSRIKARSDLFEMDMLLDVNIDLFPVAQGEKISVCLATTLKLDGAQMPHDARTKGDLYDPGLAKHPSLMDKYDYVMYGRVFKYKDASSSGQTRADVFVSYGGLLMQLTGDPKQLQELDLDLNVYLLMRRAN